MCLHHLMLLSKRRALVPFDALVAPFDAVLQAYVLIPFDAVVAVAQHVPCNLFLVCYNFQHEHSSMKLMVP